MKKEVHIIGSGFAALSASCYLAKAGYSVQVYEKNEAVGGRASQWKHQGFTFDMGPSWYWMPDIFEKFFGDFDKHPKDYYKLDRLDPAYQVFFHDEVLTIGDSLEMIKAEFERIEPGSSQPLESFMNEAATNYDIAINQMVYKPGHSPLELVSPATVVRVGQFFKTISQLVRKRFKNPMLVSVLEFPVLFLGAKPSDTPAFYNFMNHADFGLGTWHPKGGMYKVIEGMYSLARSLGVTFHLNSPVDRLHLNTHGRITEIEVNHSKIPVNTVLSGADYHHTEQLLPENKRQYSERYWEKRTFAPSSLLYFVGFDTKITGVKHHNLFFDTDFDRHAEAIYDDPSWPESPLFYANFPSVSDDSMAPEGCENAFFLMPLAPGLEDSEQQRRRYFDMMLDRLQSKTGQDLRKHILFKRSFCVDDFKDRYNSYKGNAYGMANTLRQTAFLRPGLRSKKIPNLFFTGQLTVPGPGVPPSLISGKLAAEEIIKNNL